MIATEIVLPGGSLQSAGHWQCQHVWHKILSYLHMHCPVLLSVLYRTKGQNTGQLIKYWTPGNPTQKYFFHDIRFCYWSTTHIWMLEISGINCLVLAYLENSAALQIIEIKTINNHSFNISI